MTCDACTATYPNPHDADCTRLADTEATMRAEARADRAARLIWKRDRVVDALAVFALIAVVVNPTAQFPLWVTLLGVALIGAYVSMTATLAVRARRA